MPTPCEDHTAGAAVRHLTPATLQASICRRNFARGGDAGVAEDDRLGDLRRPIFFLHAPAPAAAQRHGVLPARLAHLQHPFPPFPRPHLSRPPPPSPPQITAPRPA